MQVTSFKRHDVTECECCGSVMWCNKGQDIGSVYRVHLATFTKCKQWHDELPTFESLRGILKESSEGSGE